MLLSCVWLLDNRRLDSFFPIQGKHILLDDDKDEIVQYLRVSRVTRLEFPSSRRY